MRDKPGADPNAIQSRPGRAVVDLKKLVDKARADVALSNPVGFLIRLMSGEMVDGERLSLRDRMDVAKYLTGRLVPNLESHEVTTETRGMPPPLVISLNVTPQESMRVVSEQTRKDDEAMDMVAETIGS